MSSSTPTSTTVHRLLPLIAIVLFSAALWVLHDALRQYHYHHVLAQLRATPPSQVLIALGLTALSYLVLMSYDHLAVSYIRHPLGATKVSLSSFISYAFSNSMGLSLLTAGSIRYRLYSAWGLSTEEIARLVAFTVLTFWLGIATVGGIVFLVEPLNMPVLRHLSMPSVRPIGLLFATLVICYLLAVSFRQKPLHLRNWVLPLPTMRLAWTQLLIGSLDWVLAGSVLFVLLPEATRPSLLQFLGIYLLAQVVALISNIPGGLGVFESIILLSTPGIPADALVGSMLIYRGIYYLLPLTLAALLLGGTELLQRRSRITQALQQAGQWVSVLAPHLLAATTLVSGAVLLFSAATPAVPGRLHWLKGFLPLPVIELSHFLGSLVGVWLLLLARGLQRRIDAAYVLTAILLGTGSLLSLLKGADYEEAILLGLIMLALLPCRRYFYRQSSLFNEPFSFGWSVTVVLVLASSLWLGLFAYKHVNYSSELWWQFALRGDAPRFLRGAVGATTLLLTIAVARLLRPAPRDPDLPGEDALQHAKAIICQSSSTMTNLALLGDKALLFDDQQRGFVMYGINGRAWVALGDPAGPAELARDLAWKFRALVERHGGLPVFYEVGTTMLPVYLDMGLTLYKLGEEASVPLAEFSLEGSQRSGLRYIHRRLDREGCRFDVLPTDGIAGVMPELRRISDDWLKEKSTREKGFSLGYFDESYLRNFPVAVVRQEGRIVAFANVWAGTDKQELSLDLMRFDSQAPHGVMDYLFISLMLWGKEQGFQSFELGMAPLSGLKNQAFAPLWNRIGAVVFRHGEHFYNFEGLREYKEKFNPHWEPRYLACPGGLALPRILVNIAALISGGIKGIVAK